MAPGDCAHAKKAPSSEKENPILIFIVVSCLIFILMPANAEKAPLSLLDAQ